MTVVCLASRKYYTANDIKIKKWKNKNYTHIVIINDENPKLFLSKCGVQPEVWEIGKHKKEIFWHVHKFKKKKNQGYVRIMQNSAISLSLKKKERKI
jgi:hypothetical protein